MMDRDEAFSPETVDEQINQSSEQLDASSFIPDARLIQDLHNVYAEYVGMRDRVRERLTESAAYKAAIQQSGVEQQPSKRKRQAMQGSLFPVRASARQWGQVAAVFFAVLLVGSMVWVFSLTRSLHGGTASLNPIQSLLPSSPTSSQTVPANTISSTSIAPLQAIRMVNASDGWALTTKNTVLKTNDSGHHWQDVTPQARTPGILTQGEFLTAQLAWIARQETPGSGQNPSITIFHTSDGGASWQAATINNVTGELADAPRFINTQQGWLITAEAEGMMHYRTNVYQTTDGGQTWTNTSGPVDTTEVFGISFSNAQTGWIGLEWPGPAIQIEKSVNGGQIWQRLQLPMPAGINTESIINTRTTAPVLIGANGLLPVHITFGSNTQARLVLYTAYDNGTTWTAGMVAPFDSTDVYALDAQHVWAEEISSNTLHFSSDGGKTWVQLSQTPHHLGALSFADTHYGWAIDDAGNLYQTANGGTSWQRLS